MTSSAASAFDARVDALTPLGLTPRQTRFLVTVLLHSGFCLRRQYATFAGLQYGKPVRDFLDALVTRDLARRFVYRRDRGYLYHLHARSLYRVIGQEDSRNRRVTGPALIARKLMILDFVVSRPDVEWAATEAEKVELFTNRFTLSEDTFPKHTHAPTQPEGDPSTRYFPHKLPIFVTADPPVPHFVCLSTAPGGTDCDTFLRDHARLLDVLERWTVVVVAPGHTASPIAYRRAFDRFIAASSVLPPGWAASDVRWYVETRRAVDDQQLSTLSVADLARFRDLRSTANASILDHLYASWLSEGESFFSRPADASASRRAAAGHLEIHLLPHRYTQFGDLPGVY